MATISRDQEFMRLAIEQARIGAGEGGLPIGAALVGADEVIGTGRNRLIQYGSTIRHGETDCLDNAGRLPAEVYAHSTLYTTMSPCQMCAGALLLYQIPRVVIGENRSWRSSEELLQSQGIDVVVLDLEECATLMREFTTDNPGLWEEQAQQCT